MVAWSSDPVDPRSTLTRFDYCLLLCMTISLMTSIQSLNRLIASASGTIQHTLLANSLLWGVRWLMTLTTATSTNAIVLMYLLRLFCLVLFWFQAIKIICVCVCSNNDQNTTTISLFIWRPVLLLKLRQLAPLFISGSFSAVDCSLSDCWFGLHCCLCACICVCSVPFGSIRFHLVPFGSIRFRLVPFGSIWFGLCQLDVSQKLWSSAFNGRQIDLVCRRLISPRPLVGIVDAELDPYQVSRWK